MYPPIDTAALHQEMAMSNVKFQGAWCPACGWWSFDTIDLRDHLARQHCIPSGMARDWASRIYSQSVRIRTEYLHHESCLKAYRRLKSKSQRRI